MDGFKCDVYSTGILFADLSAPRCELFEDMGQKAEEIVKAVALEKLRPFLPVALPPTISQLIVSMWAHDPRQRPCIQDVLKIVSDAQGSGVSAWVVSER